MAKCVLLRKAQNKFFCRLDSEINTASVSFIFSNGTPFSFLTTLDLHGEVCDHFRQNSVEERLGWK